MKYEIIKTDNYLLVVDESEIKIGDWYYLPRTNEGYKCQEDPTELELEKRFGVRKIIAHLPLNGSPTLEGVDLLPPLGDDVANIANQLSKAYSVYQTAQDDIYPGIVIGYNAAKEKYKYTEEDLRKAIQLAWEADSIDGTVDLNIVLHYADNNDLRTKWSEDEIIQSLSQPKMPIGFECVTQKLFKHNEFMEREFYDSILTTTTPEGYTEWMGIYIYE